MHEIINSIHIKSVISQRAKLVRLYFGNSQINTNHSFSTAKPSQIWAGWVGSVLNAFHHNLATLGRKTYFFFFFLFLSCVGLLSLVRRSSSIWLLCDCFFHFIFLTSVLELLLDYYQLRLLFTFVSKCSFVIWCSLWIIIFLLFSFSSIKSLFSASR